MIKQTIRNIYSKSIYLQQQQIYTPIETNIYFLYNLLHKFIRLNQKRRFKY